MSEITEEEWQLLREQFGDLAYEEPHNHQRFLSLLRDRLPDKEDQTKK